MQSTPRADDLGGKPQPPARHELGTRGGLAAAWLAMQLTRLVFLPLIGLGLAMRQAERRAARRHRAGIGNRAAATDV